MHRIVVFCEDSFHESFSRAILNRFASEYAIEIEVQFLSARGGLPKLHGELRQFLRDLNRRHGSPPDAIVVLADANCKGHAERKRLMTDALQHYPALAPLTVLGIPDPHIERWMLVDSDAFRSVFGRGCTLPGIECAKDRYKSLLRQEIRQSGIEPNLGGQEFAEDLVAVMNLQRADIEPSLRLFLRDLRARFLTWRNT
ncbi:MAG: hypothetical protein R2762_19285 [Bryobacteraceae bacterium]